MAVGLIAGLGRVGQIKDCSASHFVALPFQDLVEQLLLLHKASSIVQPVVSSKIADYSHNYHEEIVLRRFYILDVVVAAVGRIEEGNMTVVVADTAGVDYNFAENSLLVAGSVVVDNNTLLEVAIGIAVVGIDYNLADIVQLNVYQHSHSRIPHSVDCFAYRDENELPNPIQYHAQSGLRECDRDLKRPACDSMEEHRNEYPTSE